MAPQSREDQIIDLTEIIEEGDSMDASPDAVHGEGKEVELDALFADLEENRTDADGREAESGEIDFDAIFSEAERAAGRQDLEENASGEVEDESLNFDALFAEEDEPEAAKTGDAPSSDAESVEMSLELDSLFNDGEDPVRDAADSASEQKEAGPVGLEDFFTDEPESAAASISGEATQEDAGTLEFKALYEDDLDEDKGLPEFDGTIEEIEEIDLSGLSAEEDELGEGDELKNFEPLEAPEPASPDTLMALEEPFSASDLMGEGADLSDLDALIDGLEGEEQTESDVPARLQTDVQIEEFSLEEDEEGEAVLPRDLLDAGFEAEAVKDGAPEHEQRELEQLLPRLHEEIAHQVEDRMAALSAEWTEREQHLLSAIERLEKENESLRALLEERQDAVTGEDFARYKQELKEELVAELRRSVPAEAAKVIREEISALMKSLSEE
jgi:pilus assembly protein FimV